MDNGGSPEVSSNQNPGVEAPLQMQMVVPQAPSAMAPSVDLLAPTFLMHQMIVNPDSDENNFFFVVDTIVDGEEYSGEGFGIFWKTV